MDRIYRYQRSIYDLTRRYFLFGRDTLLDAVVSEGYCRNVLEIGCGTARNLIKLAHRAPLLRLAGLDASLAMLETAAESIRRAGFNSRISLLHGLAEDDGLAARFAEPNGFDVVFFSYSLSMIDDWSAALDSALAAVRPGGRLLVVDFWDQRSYPPSARSLLQAWLRCFHVAFQPGHIEQLTSLAAETRGALHVRGIGGTYAYLAELTTADTPPNQSQAP